MPFCRARRPLPNFKAARTDCPLLALSGHRLVHCTCPLLAQSGHAELHCTCPLSGAKRTCLSHRKMSASDLKRARPLQCVSLSRSV